MIAPQTIAQGYDHNYNRVSRETTPQERRAWLEGHARMWEREATTLEASADRWAARGAHDQAANNLATAQEYRREADACRAEAQEIKP
jgi:hypothetical protein